VNTEKLFAEARKNFSYYRGHRKKQNLKLSMDRERGDINGKSTGKKFWKDESFIE